MCMFFLFTTYHRSSPGAVYIYVTDDSGASWSMTKKLLPWDGTPSTYFGCSVAIEGEVVVVGAYAALNTVSVQNTGKYYGFERV